MHLNKLALALSLAVFALPMTAMAEDAPAADAPAAEAEAEGGLSPFTWNLSYNSDYLFRGYSLNNTEPAFQGGLDYSFGDSGFAVGTWLSQVDFNDQPAGPTLEQDWYVGWTHALSDKWSFNVLYDYYTYLGAKPGYGVIDYGELFVSATYAGQYKFTVAYANDYGQSGFSALYYEGSGTWDIGNDFSMFASLGYQTWDSGLGLKDYANYSVGVTRTFGRVTAKLGWYGTDNNGKDNFGNWGGNRAFLSFAIGG